MSENDEHQRSLRDCEMWMCQMGSMLAGSMLAGWMRSVASETWYNARRVVPVSN